MVKEQEEEDGLVGIGQKLWEEGDLDLGGVTGHWFCIIVSQLKRVFWVKTLWNSLMGTPGTRSYSTTCKYKAMNSYTEMLRGFFSLPGIAPTPSWHSPAWFVAPPLGREEESGVCAQYCSLEVYPRNPFVPHLAWSVNVQSGYLGAAKSKGEHGQLVAPVGLLQRFAQSSMTGRRHSTCGFPQLTEREEGSMCPEFWHFRELWEGLV